MPCRICHQPGCVYYHDRDDPSIEILSGDCRLQAAGE